MYHVLITARAAVHRYGIYIMLPTMSFPQVLSEVEKKLSAAAVVEVEYHTEVLIDSVSE